MEYTVNTLLKDTISKRLIRIVYIDKPSAKVYLFECKEKIRECGMPYELSLEELDAKLADKSLEICSADVFRKSIDEKDISDRNRVIRKRRLEVVELLIGHNDTDIFFKVLRNARIKYIRKMWKISKPSLYKWLKMYWRNGMTGNALLPDFDKCGASGKERKSGITEEVRQLIRKGYRLYHRLKKYTVRESYNQTIKHLFDKSKHGKKFSFNIFWEHGSKPYRTSDRKRNNKGDRDYENNLRGLKGRSLDIVDGPCQLYQIDNTPRDIKVVASFDRTQSIGSPTFYAIRDVFSRAWVGIYITLDPPSYMAACNAVYVAFRPRHELIKELGLSDKHLGWFNNFKPMELMADRAEFLGPKSTTFVNNTGISIGNTAAYRPWMKGDVEKMIDLVQERLYHNFLGNGQSPKEKNNRLAKDPHHEATVTLEELYAITWIVLNEFNNSHWIDDYPLSEEMVRDGVKKIPAEIHKWAIENGYGIEENIDQRSLYLSTLEGKFVTPKREGFRLNKQDFVPVDDEVFTAFEDAINADKVAKEEIVFDPRHYKSIFWKRNGEFHRLRLRGKKDVVYPNVWEARHMNAVYNEMKKDSQDAEQDVRNENDTEIEERINKNKSTGKSKGKNSRKAKSVDRERVRHTSKELSGEAGVKAATTVSAEVTKPKATSAHDSQWDDLIDNVNS